MRNKSGRFSDLLFIVLSAGTGKTLEIFKKKINTVSTFYIKVKTSSSGLRVARFPHSCASYKRDRERDFTDPVRQNHTEY